MSFFIIYRLFPKSSRTLIILSGSVIFYAFWDWRYLGLLLLLSLVNFYSGIAILHIPYRKIILAFCLTFNFSVLFVFKYFNFFVSNLKSLISNFGFNLSTDTLSFLIPLGLSFYIFQVSSYIIDIYRGELLPTRSLVSFSAFLSYFPHMAAGPIMKAQDLLPQIERPRDKLGYNSTITALLLIANGLFRKIVIADTLAPMVNRIFSSSQSFDWKSLLTASIAFGLQIYGDFSGYSNIARGVSRLLGIELIINFRQPYFATSIQEFWRRWHISLSQWFRDYLYIPIGGNQTKKKVRRYFNLMIVMLVAGFWHGAEWGFLIWGLLHGSLLIFHRFIADTFPAELRNLNVRSFAPLQKLIFVLLTNISVFTLWIIFRNPDPKVFTHIFSNIFQKASGYFDVSDLILVLSMLALTIIVDIFERAWCTSRWLRTRTLSKPLLSGMLVGTPIFISLVFQSSDVIPFIYFNF